MSIRYPFLAIAISAATCFGIAATASAQNTNLSLGKTYAYFKKVPGQPPNHYMDDGPINGPHLVHSTGLGAYGKGNLTDGAVSTAAVGGPGTTHLAIWAPLGIPAPAVDVIIDLGSVFIVTDFVIGTVVAAGSNNNAPDDVTISYSASGTTPASFGSARYYNMEAIYGPLADGHHDLKLKVGTVIPARYVKFSFDGGSMAEPNGSDPNEKYMLDEITINGLGANCKAATSNYGKGLAGRNGVPTLTTSALPKFLAKINVLALNSSGAATSGLLLVGVQELSVSFLGGTLLVNGVLQVPVQVPAGGLVLPITVPGGPCTVPICVQLLQLDSAALFGVSMTPGMRLDLGT